jgi:predicted RNA-binding Zn ribbon-like protein
MSQHLPAMFIADSTGLDFLNSIATPVDTPVDWIANGDGLLDWLKQANLVPREVLDAIKRAGKPGELDQLAKQARELREWFRGFVRKHMGGRLTPRALRELEPLNRLLARDETFTQLVHVHDGDHDHLELHSLRQWRAPQSLLLPIGEALAKFACEENFADVKACEGSSCTLLFVDRTRRKARRWCTMAICGNRAKQAAHRERLRNRG